MITAIYTRSNKRINNNNPLLPFIIVMMISYAFGCLCIRMSWLTNSISFVFNELCTISQQYGYFATLFALCLPKLILILIVAFTGYFCFGKVVIFAISAALSVFYGGFSGYLYYEYSLKGVLIFALSFLLFFFVSCIIYVHRLNDASKYASIFFRSAFSKEFNNINIDNKQYLLKFLFSALGLLLLTFLQALIFKINIYIAT